MRIESKETRTKIGLILLVALLVLMITNWAEVVSAIAIVWSIIFPFILGGMIAYVLNIPMRFFERRIAPNSKNKIVKKARRPLAILATLLFLILVVVVVLVIIIPQLGSAISTIAASVPDAMNNFNGWLNSQEAFFSDLLNLDFETNIDWNSIVTGFADGLSSIGQRLISTSMSFLSTSVSAVTNIVLAVIFSIYILVTKENLGRQFHKLKKAYLPQDINLMIENLLFLADDIFSSFIVGSVIEAVILGTLVTVVLFILRIPYAFMLGVLQGVFAFIPIFGAFFSGAIGFVILLAVDPMNAIIYLIFLVVIQQVEGDFIYPMVVGDSIGLPGIWVMAAVTVGGGLAGISGMLLAVPTAALLYKVLRIDANYRIESRESTPDRKFKIFESFRHKKMNESHLEQ